MACCVIVAALLGGLAMVKAMLTLTWEGKGAAQAWRLDQRKGSNE